MNSFARSSIKGSLTGGIGEVHVVCGANNAITEVVTPDTVDDSLGEVRVVQQIGAKPSVHREDLCPVVTFSFFTENFSGRES